MSLFNRNGPKNAEAAIEKIAIEFQISEPFFGSIFRRLKKEFTPKIGTIGLYFGGENIALCINPDFINKLSYKEKKAVCEHILLHICLKHIIQVKKIGAREREVFDITADLEVNQRIKNLPRNAVSIEDVFGKENDRIERRREAAYYYSYFPKDIKLESLKTIDNHEFWSGDCPLQDLISDRDIEGLSPEDNELFDPNKKTTEPFDPDENRGCNAALCDEDISIEDLLRKADEDAEGNLPGNLPAGLLRKIHVEEDEIRANKDWYKILRQYLNFLKFIFALMKFIIVSFLFLSSFIFKGNLKSVRIIDELIKSKRRPNKKLGFPFPSIKVDPAPILNVAVCVDGSGSVDNRTFQEFMQEINCLYDREIQIVLIGFDSEVKEENIIRNYNPQKWLKEKKLKNLFPGELGGGTDFVPPVEVGVNLSPKPDCIIMFTDSFDKGNLEPPEIPIIFVLSQRNENFYEWAECIFMDN